MMAGSVDPTSQRPTQAVILAGGRGTRLGRLTETLPKPMVEFHDKPFLEYLIEQLREQGFERVLLLLGYLPDAIRDHFGFGSRWGIDISYAITAPDDLTSYRLQRAAHAIDPCFLLLYCDNYWPMRFGPMWDRFRASGLPAMVTVYRNDDGYSCNNNVRVLDDGRIATFDKGRKAPGLQGVEIGYAVLRKSVLDLLPGQPSTFEEAVYPQLAARGELLANVTEHRYYSVGSLERLPLTHEFFARRPTILLDRDGVLNRRAARGEYVHNRDEFEWMPGAKTALRLLAEAGYRVAVVSNQAGIARGVMTEFDLAELHEWMKADAAASGGRIDAIYYCPHGWDEGCSCRKPAPGMLFQAQRDFNLDLTRTIFVGDDDRDREAAERAGALFEMVTLDRTLFHITEALVHTHTTVGAP